MLSMSALTLKARLPDLPRRLNADALFRMGLRYSTPADGDVGDAVTAHALFDLAARLGSLEAKVYRRELSDEMDPDDVAEANSVVREWLARAWRHRDPFGALPPWRRSARRPLPVGNGRQPAEKRMVTWPSG
jgi:hypothetical protein